MRVFTVLAGTPTMLATSRDRLLMMVDKIDDFPLSH
jgi:hypothetical protein